MLSHQPLELADHARLPSKGQLGLDPLLDRSNL
jgi:hypothetical protein